MPGRWRRTVSSVAVAVLLGACASEQSCAPAPATAACPDLVFRGFGYQEFREFHASSAFGMQQVGGATYPACNVADGCPGSELAGFGATSVWLIKGVDIADAVIGKRQNSDAFAIFVRVGLEPDRLALPG